MRRVALIFLCLILLSSCTLGSYPTKAQIDITNTSGVLLSSDMFNDKGSVVDIRQRTKDDVYLNIKARDLGHFSSLDKNSFFLAAGDRSDDLWKVAKSGNIEKIRTDFLPPNTGFTAIEIMPDGSIVAALNKGRGSSNKYEDTIVSFNLDRSINWKRIVPLYVGSMKVTQKGIFLAGGYTNFSARDYNDIESVPAAMYLNAKDGSVIWKKIYSDTLEPAILGSCDFFSQSSLVCSLLPNDKTVNVKIELKDGSLTVLRDNGDTYTGSQSIQCHNQLYQYDLTRPELYIFDDLHLLKTVLDVSKYTNQNFVIFQAFCYQDRLNLIALPPPDILSTNKHKLYPLYRIQLINGPVVKKVDSYDLDFVRLPSYNAYIPGEWFSQTP